MKLKYLLFFVFFGASIYLFWWFIKPSTVPVVLNQPLESPWADLYDSKNESDEQALRLTTRDTFFEFTSKSAGTNAWQTFTKESKQIPITVGLPALDIKVPAQIIPALNTADWGVHSCKSTATKPKFILRLLFALGTQGELVTYTEKQQP